MRIQSFLLHDQGPKQCTDRIVRGVFVLSPEVPIQDVSDTSFWVAYFRAKESQRPDAIFRDPFAARLAGEHGKRISESMPDFSRYTEWAVVSRTVIIDRFIEKAIQEGTDAVLNLGAGLDARPYRMNLPENLDWVEVDYSSIMAHKKKILANETPRCRLTQVELDLANRTQRDAFFKTVLPKAEKVLVLTEGLIPYLNETQVSELAEDLLKRPQFQAWISEYFDPRVYRHLKANTRTRAMKNSPFQFYPKNWFGFFNANGWTEKETVHFLNIVVEFKRTPPMPKWVKWILPLIPKKVIDDALKMSGYTVMKRL
ncbi:MAG: class I SAM-dependent methyltransferase [Bdellovibrionales bacterium]|nr:class I SAM-dependent methyltransferase [Bdellovibrionales bacterium]